MLQFRNCHIPLRINFLMLGGETNARHNQSSITLSITIIPRGNSRLAYWLNQRK